MVKIILPGSKKRPDLPKILNVQHQKKRKIDNRLKIECGKILKTLMTHEYGNVFNNPVDPVLLEIPDYFDIISNPMDLGTIHKKLEDNIYPSAEAFADDIRLTFSNAMRYNPPTNMVHLMAKHLNIQFDKYWRLLEAKLIKMSRSVPEQGRTIKKPIDTKTICNKTPAKVSESRSVKKQRPTVTIKAKKTEDTSKIITFSEMKPLISCDEKLRLKKQLMVAIRGDLSGPLRGFLRKYGLIYSGREKIESVFGTFNDDTLCELRRVLKGYLGTNVQKDKDDIVETCMTKEIIERRKLDEKSDIESRIKAARAAKEALLESAKSDLQMRRDQERERVEKMKRTVTINDNLTFLRELEKLCQYSGIKNPLEKLGLRLKEEYYYGYEYMDDDNDVIYDDLEDGEIF